MFSLNFPQRSRKFHWRPKHLVVPVFQGPWFISGINNLVTVKFRQNNERLGRSTLSDERALTLVREVTDIDRRSTVGDTAEMCDLKRAVLQ